MFAAWKEFKRGKLKRRDVALFEFDLEDNIFQLHNDLISKSYIHGHYSDFYVCDPKKRHIHKASIRDRVLHQAVFRILYPIFNEHFIYDSYSSRLDKGTHFGVERLAKSCRKVSGNWEKTAYALKCDVRKFFDSIDRVILRNLIVRKVDNEDAIQLIDLLLMSFEKTKGKGLPLGNVTSQLFANIYLNEFDQFMKHELKIKHYFRYCDDFVIIHNNREFLKRLIFIIEDFLRERLLLELHPNKVEIRKIKQGIDFLGYVILPDAIVIRTKTKKRVLRKLNDAYDQWENGIISREKFQSIIVSYIGVFIHCRNREMKMRLEMLQNIV